MHAQRWSWTIEYVCNWSKTMITITTIDSTGEPLTILNLPDQAHVDANTVGVSYVEGLPPPDSYYFDGEWVTKPSQTSPNHVWDKVNKAWIDPRTLEQVKLAQWELIKESRLAALVAPLVTSYGAFDASANSQKAITDAVLMLQTLASLGTPSTIDFTLADNTTVTLTTEQMIQVGLQLGLRTQQIFSQGRARRDSILAATTISAVEGIVW